MAWKVEHLPEEETLLLAASGLHTAEEARKQTLQSLELLVQRRIPRVLIDYSEAQIEVPLSRIYELPDLYQKFGVSRQTIVAVVVPKDGYKREAFEFYEDICLNHGYRVKLFETIGAARDWLREKPLS